MPDKIRPYGTDVSLAGEVDRLGQDITELRELALTVGLALARIEGRVARLEERLSHSSHRILPVRIVRNIAQEETERP